MIYNQVTMCSSTDELRWIVVNVFITFFFVELKCKTSVVDRMFCLMS